MNVFGLNPAVVGTGKVFPPEIESQKWIGFHGTSSYHSDSIEKNGFSFEKPFLHSDIERVIQIAEKCRVPAFAVSGFLRMSSTSFSPSSELALSYTKRKSLGGQGLEYVREAAQAVIDGQFKEASSSDCVFRRL